MHECIFWWHDVGSDHKAPGSTYLHRLLPTCQPINPGPQAPRQSRVRRDSPVWVEDSPGQLLGTLLASLTPRRWTKRQRQRDRVRNNAAKGKRMRWGRTPHALFLAHLSSPENRSEQLSPWGTQTQWPGQVLPWYSCSAEIPHNQQNRPYKALRGKKESKANWNTAFSEDYCYVRLKPKVKEGKG